MLEIGKTYYYLETAKFLNYDPIEWEFFIGQKDKDGNIVPTEVNISHVVECVLEWYTTTKDWVMAAIKVGDAELQRNAIFLYNSNTEALANADFDIEKIKKDVLENKFLKDYEWELAKAEAELNNQNNVLEIVRQKDELIESLDSVDQPLLRNYLNSIKDWIIKTSDDMNKFMEAGNTEESYTKWATDKYNDLVKIVQNIKNNLA